LSLIGDSVADDLRQSEGLPRTVDLASLNAVRRASSRKVFYALTMLVKGAPLSILRSIEDSSGYEARRLLCAKYDANLAGRQHSLLTKILRPAAFPTEAQPWEDAMLTWKREVAKWERLSLETLPESVKITVLLENAPPGVRATLAMAGHTTADAVE